MYRKVKFAYSVSDYKDIYRGCSRKNKNFRNVYDYYNKAEKHFNDNLKIRRLNRVRKSKITKRINKKKRLVADF